MEKLDALEACMNEWLQTEEHRWFEPSTSITFQHIHYQRHLEFTMAIGHNGYVPLSSSTSWDMAGLRGIVCFTVTGRTGVSGWPARQHSQPQRNTSVTNLESSPQNRPSPSSTPTERHRNGRTLISLPQMLTMALRWLTCNSQLLLDPPARRGLQRTRLGWPMDTEPRRR